MTHPASLFKTPEGEAQYLAAYDATLKLWPAPYEAMDVPTRFGRTHINAAGPKEAPPLLLLPGMLLSSTQWYLNIGELSRHYRTYAVDILGDVGKSVPTALPQTRAESAEWIAEVLNGLKIEQIDVVGLSLGGWLAMNLALCDPDRVRKLVTLAPAASLAPLNWQFFLRFMLTNLPIRSFGNSFTQWLFATPKAATKFTALIAQVSIGAKNFKFQKMVYPEVFADDELQRLQPPTLVLIGEKEVIYKPRPALDRARRLIPGVEAELVPQAGHASPLDQPAWVNARILKFLNKK